MPYWSMFGFISWHSWDRKGLIQRLSPSIPVTIINYKKENFWAVACGPMPLAALVFAGRHGYLSRCKCSVDVLGSWLFTWTVMALHDSYFWTVHTLMHLFKGVYVRIHQWHHSTNGDLTVFSTAYGDIFDIAITFTPFYSGLMLWLYLIPSWNPLNLLFLIWAMNGVNLMGHCGYKLPAWVYVPGSLGVLLTPLAQRPRHHYIHHLDPRYNRSLYFTWCDRLAGTFRETHPKVIDGPNCFDYSSSNVTLNGSESIGEKKTDEKFFEMSNDKLNHRIRS